METIHIRPLHSILNHFQLEIDVVNTSQTLADHSFLYPSVNDSFGFDLSIEASREQENSSVCPACHMDEFSIVS